MTPFALYSPHPACSTLGKQAYQQMQDGIAQKNKGEWWFNRETATSAEARSTLAADGTAQECEQEINKGVLDDNGVPTSPYDMGISGMTPEQWSAKTGVPLPGQTPAPAPESTTGPVAAAKAQVVDRNNQLAKEWDQLVGQ